MATIRSQLLQKSWTRDDYVISTDPSWIPVTKLNDFLGSDDMYWAKAMPEDALVETIANSLCFGLYEYKSSSHNPDEREFIGFARCVTDYTTILYLTDVYMTPQTRGTGLGTWLVATIKEIMDSMPYVRRILFLTSNWERSVPFYQKVLGASLMEGRPPRPGEIVNPAVMTRTGPGLAEH